MINLLRKAQNLITRIKWKLRGRNDFSIGELHEILTNRSSYIIHCASMVPFSGTPDTMRLGPIEKLERVISRDLEISCSTITPSESFQTGSCNGPLGVIIVPKTVDSITKVGAQDIGSIIDTTSKTGKRTTILKSLTKVDITNSIINKVQGHYNEWNVYNYKVAGIVIFGPLEFSPLDSAQIILTEQQLYQAFPNQRFFSHHQSKLIELSFTISSQSFAYKTTINIRDLYPEISR